MCGIVCIHSRARPAPSGSLHRATRALLHRGPDEQAEWTSDDGRVGLGHTRLSIVDLETGTQPIASEDERLRIVVNGEFYDHRRIRRELEANGHRFRTRSDSEIALHLYEDLGRDCLNRLRGEFAFVIWDGETRTLFAARDRFGIKPLFYAEVGDVLYLASEAKALFAAGVPAAWDEEAVYQNLFLCADPRRSLFEGVRQLPAGHCLVAGNGPVRIERYWDLDYPRGEEVLDEGECVERVRDLLEESIRLRLMADVPVGCLLSGGVDSSAILSIANRSRGEPPRSFTIGFDDPGYDERGHARATADHVGGDLVETSADDAALADHFEDSVWAGETIQLNPHGTARYLLSRSVRRAGYKVVLAGEGADELFAGYVFCRKALDAGGSGSTLRRWWRLIAAFLKPMNAAERSLKRTSPWLVRTGRLVRFPDLWIRKMAGGIEALRSVFPGDFLRRFANLDPYAALLRGIDVKAHLRGREPVKQILYLWIRTLFVNYLLSADRVDMAHAVEVRLPYLDHVLFEYARRIPATLLSRNGREKHVLREAVEPFVTRGVYEREKRPFLAPPSALRPGSRLNERVQETLRGIRGIPFFDRRAVVRLLDEMAGMPEDRRVALDGLLMMMTSLAVLHDRYGL